MKYLFIALSFFMIWVSCTLFYKTEYEEIQLKKAYYFGCLGIAQSCSFPKSILEICKDATAKEWR